MNRSAGNPGGPWRPLVAILLYALAVVGLGALLAPWLFRAVDPYTEAPFRRVFDRALLIVALLGLWPLLRHLGFASWSETGWSRRSDGWRHLLFGTGLGIVSLVITIAVSVALGHRSLDFGKRELPLLVAKLLLTAGIVAVIEETFFRGGLLQALERAVPAAAALAISSAIYSAVHFLKPKGVLVPPAEVDWLSGFDCLGQILAKSVAASGIAPGFITLFLAGWILGWGLRRTGALYFSIGLHAGWIVPNELTRKLGGGLIVEDWVAWPTLLVLWVVAMRVLPRDRNRSSARPTFTP